MKRNIKNIIAKRSGNIPSVYDLLPSDAITLKELATKDGKTDVTDAIYLSFILGYELGTRAERRKHANKRKD